ncbi:putative phage abortive infection protein [Hansschlegelia plantiphila]
MRQGLLAFRSCWREISYHIERFAQLDDDLFKIEVANSYINEVHNRYESTFGPYFRIVYTILYRIKHDRYLSEEDKNKFANLFRCQVSSFELTMIGINGLAPVSKDLSDYLNHFHFLKYAPEGERRVTLRRCYPQEAFEGRG